MQSRDEYYLNAERWKSTYSKNSAKVMFPIPLSSAMTTGVINDEQREEQSHPVSPEIDCCILCAK